MGRKTSFQNRKKGLKKKIYELSTLCGVDACLIVFGPNQGDQLVVPETWPEDPKVVLNIIERFKKKSTEQGQGKKRKLAKYSDDRIKNLSEEELKALLASLDSKLDLVNLKIADLMKGNHNQNVEDDHLMKGNHNQNVEDDHVTELNEYSVALLDQNPPPPFFWDSSDASKTDDMCMHIHHHYQSLSFLNQLGNPHRLSIDYMPLETTRMINGMDCNGASNSTIPYHHPTVVVPPINYSPMLQTLDEMALVNNAGGEPLDCYFSPNVDTMMHSYFAPQLHQISDFSNLEDSHYFAGFEPNGVACPSTLHALDYQQSWIPYEKGY